MSTTICFDFGNTRLKAAIFKGNQLEKLELLENDALAPLLISNGTAAAGIKGVGVPVNGINGNPNDPTTTFTSPASLVQKLNSSPPVPLANVAITVVPVIKSLNFAAT